MEAFNHTKYQPHDEIMKNPTMTAYSFQAYIVNLQRWTILWAIKPVSVGLKGFKSGKICSVTRWN